MELTNEQNDCLKAVARGDEIIKINAFAGTGKTSTLVAIANSYPNKSILYLAFNKSIQLEAREKFGGHVDVKTTHSLAYGQVVRQGNYRVRGEYKIKEIEKILNVSYEMAKITSSIFANFCNSASSTINYDELDQSLTNRAKKHAFEFFEMMAAGEIDVTHSFYLKAFQMGLLTGKLFTKQYDIIMLDEAQDTNDVTLSIFYLLNAKQKIVVGDRHQQIYSFRGSVNAMQKVKASIFMLTHSFRFQNYIATRATNFLRIFKNERNSLKGVPYKKIEKVNNRAFISRTNAMLINKIAELIEDGKFYKTVREPYNIFALTLNLHKLINNESYDLDKGFTYLKSFKKDYERAGQGENLLEYITKQAELADDRELIFACKMVNKYKDRIVKLYDKSVENFNSDKECSIFLTTAHTAKGLEWEKVTLMRDFAIFANIAKHFAKTIQSKEEALNTDFLVSFREDLKAGKVNQEIVDELNLYYVSITRAKYFVVDETDLFKELKEPSVENFNNSIRDEVLKFFEE